MSILKKKINKINKTKQKPNESELGRNKLH